MLKTQIEELEPTKVALRIEVEAEKVKAAFSDFYQRAALSVNIPGFRRGKVPRPVLVKHLGLESIHGQITEELLQEAYPQALREHKLRPVSQAEIEEVKLQEGLPFSFKAIIEVHPKIPEFTYKGRNHTIKRVAVNDETIAPVLKRLQEQFAKVTPMENEPLTHGDYFSGTIEVKIDGQPDAELSQENAYIRVFQEDPIFKNLLGTKPGEERAFSHLVNDEREKESPHFGKTLEYHVRIKDVSRPILPELNDDFAREVGDYSSYEQLLGKIREDMEERFRQDGEEHAIDDILGAIAKETEFPIPEALIQQTIDFFIQNLDRRWQQYGTSLKDFLKEQNKDLTAFRETFRERATQQTKVMLLTDTICDREGITVLDSEYRREVERRAQEYRMPANKLLEALAKGDGESSLRNTIIKKKVDEFLLKNNEIHYDMVNELEQNKGETHGDACTHSN
jgi:trigger factor